MKNVKEMQIVKKHYCKITEDMVTILYPVESANFGVLFCKYEGNWYVSLRDLQRDRIDVPESLNHYFFSTSLANDINKAIKNGKISKKDICGISYNYIIDPRPSHWNKQALGSPTKFVLLETILDIHKPSKHWKEQKIIENFLWDAFIYLEEEDKKMASPKAIREKAEKAAEEQDKREHALKKQQEKKKRPFTQKPKTSYPKKNSKSDNDYLGWINWDVKETKKATFAIQKNIASITEDIASMSEDSLVSKCEIRAIRRMAKIAIKERGNNQRESSQDKDYIIELQKQLLKSKDKEIELLEQLYSI